MIIAIAAIKGGVGKTTLTFCLAATLSQMGKKVLCLDLDHQGDLSAALGASKDDSEPTLGEILYAPKREQAEMLANGIIEIPECCHLITPGSNLGGYQSEIENGLASENRLDDALSEFNNIYEGYDYILLDTPKGEGLFTKNALVACDNVIIPVQTEYFALKNIPELLALISQIADRANPKISVSALVPSRMKQTSLHKSVYSELLEWDVREQLHHQQIPSWVAPPIKDLTLYGELPAKAKSLYNYPGVKQAHRAPFVAIAEYLEKMSAGDNKQKVTTNA
ncbi:MAG: AAA family ATPase [Cyanobacteria bacterium J06621_11]